MSLAAVLVRGLAGLAAPQKKTLNLLRLTRKHRCVVLSDTPAMRGMLQQVKDYITWGEITPETYQELLRKRGQEFQGREQDGKKLYTYGFVQEGKKKYKPYFSLNPPRKGFERKGIKVAYAAGGALGYRGAEINALLERMM